MELPVGKGRIWRVVYGNSPARRGRRRRRSRRRRPRSWCRRCRIPKGWWRDTAQRLLVERGDTAVGACAEDAGRQRARLAHAAARAVDTRWPRRDRGRDGRKGDGGREPRRARGRGAAVRAMARPAISRLRTAVSALVDDKSWNVRRQVAASIGEMPAADRVDPATTMLARDGADPIIVDAAVSGLKGVEAEVLTRVMQAKTAAPAPPRPKRSPMLTAAVAKSGDVAAVQRAIDVIADASQPEWQRTALLQGLDAGLPAPARRAVAAAAAAVAAAAARAERARRTRRGHAGARRDVAGEPAGARPRWRTGRARSRSSRRTCRPSWTGRAVQRPWRRPHR